MDYKHALVISPHPDDLEIGMGGTVCRLIEEGWRVTSLVVTDGRRSTTPAGLTEAQMARAREGEVRDAASLLGIQELITLGLHDASTPANKEALLAALRGLIDERAPERVYTPHPEIDKHPSHRDVSGVVSAHLGHLPAGSAPELLYYEVWTPFQHYDVLVDITPYAERKRMAVEAHRTQMDYKDYSSGVLGLNRYRAVFAETGGVDGMSYAEVFMRA